jgi:glycosyltransferase involved in cell wall biosynthesis
MRGKVQFAGFIIHPPSGSAIQNPSPAFSQADKTDRFSPSKRRISVNLMQIEQRADGPPKPDSPLTVAVVQDGARLHYAVPLAFQRAGALRAMFSEWFIPRGSAADRIRSILIRAPFPKLRPMLERRCDEIPPAAARTNLPLAVHLRAARKRFTNVELYYRHCSQSVANWVKQTGLSGANVLFGFVRNIDPDLCIWAQQQGVLTVGDQIIAPAAIEAAEAKLQAQRFPDCEPQSQEMDYNAVIEVEQKTWRHLNCVTCASPYVRDGLQAQGVAAERIHVIPYPLDIREYSVPLRESGRGPILVGFVGAVGLRKGSPYFFEVAKRLASANLKFVMIGPVQLKESIAKSAADTVELVGRVPRSQVRDWLGKFDIFLFPSTCEGSAGAAMEAMASGLPIVASPNSGTAARDGIDGFIRPYQDIDALSECVDRLARDPSLRHEMGQSARRQAESLNLDNYARKLLAAIQSTPRRSGTAPSPA